MQLIARHSDYGDFTETQPNLLPNAMNRELKAEFCINADYLESALGVWNVRLWFKDSDSAIVLIPDNGEFRHVIMPVRDK